MEEKIVTDFERIVDQAKDLSHKMLGEEASDPKIELRVVALAHIIAGMSLLYAMKRTSGEVETILMTLNNAIGGGKG